MRVHRQLTQPPAWPPLQPGQPHAHHLQNASHQQQRSTLLLEPAAAWAAPQVRAYYALGRSPVLALPSAVRVRHLQDNVRCASTQHVSTASVQCPGLSPPHLQSIMCAARMQGSRRGSSRACRRLRRCHQRQQQRHRPLHRPPRWHRCVEVLIWPAQHTTREQALAPDKTVPHNSSMRITLKLAIVVASSNLPACPVLGRRPLLACPPMPPQACRRRAPACLLWCRARSSCLAGHSSRLCRTNLLRCVSGHCCSVCLCLERAHRVTALYFCSHVRHAREGHKLGGQACHGGW